MNARERVQTTLNHETPDRCPMQISFTPEFSQRLRQDMKLNNQDGHNPHGGGNTYDLERHLQEDLLLTSVGWANCYYQDNQPGNKYTDDWGITWQVVEYKTKFGNGIYTEVCEFPLADDIKIDSYTPPNPDNPNLYKEAESLLKTYGSSHYIVGVTVTTIFETAWALRGLEQMLMDFLVDPDLAKKILDIPYQFHLEAAKKLVKMGVDMVWTGDDVGSQNGMIIDPETWRQFLKPKMATFFAELKAINPNVKIAYHSDGNIEPIIPDLIDIGLDVLNPIQPASMDPTKLKKLYGDKLCFWGTIDEQHTLPFGSPRDVINEVEDRIKNVGKNGGLIIGPTHHVQLDTPVENFWAMHKKITGN
jgi:uroporphyrinogen decarboxylase